MARQRRLRFQVGRWILYEWARADMSVLGSPRSEAAAGPPTPIPGPDDALLPPASPPHDRPTTAPLPSLTEHANDVTESRGPASPSPIRLITPYSPAIQQSEDIQTNHPLAQRGKDSGFLSPPSTSPPRRRSPREHQPAPAPSPLDLPTRADVQASQAVHRAEQSGLRGGWVMNIDAAPSASRRLKRTSQDREHPDGNEMVDIDLEGGSRERFGSPKIGEEDWRKQEHALSHVGLEQRRISTPNVSRTPSPLSIETRRDSGDQTPKATTPHALTSDKTLPQVPHSTSIRKPPPIAIGDDRESLSRMSSRTKSPDPEQEVVRFHPVTTKRMERESSFASLDSNEELLNGGSDSVGSSPAKVGEIDNGVQAQLRAEHEVSVIH